MTPETEQTWFWRVLLYKRMRLSFSRAAWTNATLLFAIWTAYGLLSGLQSHYWYSFSKDPLSWGDSLRYEIDLCLALGSLQPGRSLALKEVPHRARSSRSFISWSMSL